MKRVGIGSRRLSGCALAAFCVLGSIVHVHSSRPALTSFRLEPLWQVSVGEGGRRGVIYRGTVCPDGRSYFTESAGRVVALSVHGHITFDVLYHPDVVRTVAAACAPDGQLAVSNGREVVLLVHDGARLQVTGRIALTAFALAWTDDGLVALGQERPMRPVIWRVPAASDTEITPEALTRLEPVADPPAVSMGQLVRDGERIGYVPGGRYELHLFDAGGRPVVRLWRADPSFRAHAAPGFVPPPTPHDHVLAFHVLPGARYVAFVVTHQTQAPQYWESRLSMEVLDETFRLIGTVENGAAFGHPVGVAPNGDPLLMHVTPAGSTITRARLTRISP
jgi:hypothetical protein